MGDFHITYELITSYGGFLHNMGDLYITWGILRNMGDFLYSLGDSTMLTTARFRLTRK